MKIFIEAQSILGERAGIGQYVRSLTKHLLEVDRKNDYTLFAFKVGPKNPRSPIHGAHWRLIRWLPSKGYAFLRTYLRLWLPIDLLLAQSPDLYFYPVFVSFPSIKQKPTIVVIHDLSYVHYPQYVRGRILKRYRQDVPLSLQKATQVIAVSEHTKRDICKTYAIPEKKITVIRPGVDPTQFYPRPEKEVSKIKKKYGLPDNYLLFLGSLEPRKNISGLLSAYRGLPAALRNKYGLVIAGGKGWKSEAIQEKIDNLKRAGEQIVQPGYIKNADLPALYSGAIILTHPAHFEGFGISLIEAMACGTVVIAGRNSSMVEVVGKAGLLVDSRSVQDVSNAMKRILTDPELASRLKDAGIKTSQEYRWDKSAIELTSVFSKIERDHYKR